MNTIGKVQDAPKAMWSCDGWTEKPDVDTTLAKEVGFSISKAEV